ncbi:hypothetical protein AWV63_03945 [Micromonospora rifamycinica]|uniref:Uncharacterized protein n=1 Tax=Micromonospora rifamycinica TaxID=291594 RepID=A0A120F9X0_9ACTN|nr:hypothetical protein AWV63_03945 [Micromonospora rifamycinica]SCG47183.1 hypothetical protein GA0070623_1442 [Micromonospora rifamycinica]
MTVSSLRLGLTAVSRAVLRGCQALGGYAVMSPGLLGPVSAPPSSGPCAADRERPDRDVVPWAPGDRRVGPSVIRAKLERPFKGKKYL